jgi:predicted flavoprotein YhiN
MPAEPRHFDVIVLGAGAAGLICAATAGQRGRRVALLEHNGQPGRKILISGGGRCNFTNLHCGPENFISNNPHFAKSALALYQPRHFLELVERYGIPWHEKTLGQLFCDGSARAIVEMLLAECAAGGVEIVLNATCCGGTCGAANCAYGANSGGIYATSGGFHVETSAGEFESESLVVATGGLSIPKLGATGLGYELARQFGLTVVEPRPALVPLLLGGEEADWTKLAGVAAEVEVWAEPDSKKHPSGAKARVDLDGSDVRAKALTYQSCPDTSCNPECFFPQPVQSLPFKEVESPAVGAGAKARHDSIGFARGLKPPSPSVRFREKMLVTHRGLSGPAVLQASSYWRPGDALVVDFAVLAARAGVFDGMKQPGARRDLAAVKQALRAVLPHRLADYLAEIGGPRGWANAALEACERELRRWKFHPVGTEGFEKAEVTAGGVDTDELQARTMEARAVPGLYFIGEVVDVTGQLGGFNFQWAWASGVAAGRAC